MWPCVLGWRIDRVRARPYARSRILRRGTQLVSQVIEQSNEELVLAFLADGAEEFTSGEALSGKLGLSRAAVWKYVESLRRKGYKIEAVPAKGYRLLEIPDHITALELAPLLNTRDIGRVIHHRDSVPSTNELAFRLATEGAAHGEVVVADEQTSGKGRRGRAWASPPGVNVYFSVVLRPDLSPQRAPELTLVAAVAAAKTLRAAGASAQIKWPNDLMVGQRKIGGILTELSSEPERIHFAVLGVGINLNSAPAHYADDVSPTAISLSEARGRRVARAPFTATLWSCLEDWLDVHANEGFASVRAAWKEMSSTLGQEILVVTGERELRGVAEDIDETGALLLRTSDGSVERVVAGDVHQIRPRRQPD